jgi:hypothetical protein
MQLAPSGKASLDVQAQAAQPPADLQVVVDLLGDDREAIQQVLESFRTNTADSAHELTRAHAGDADGNGGGRLRADPPNAQVIR